MRCHILLQEAPVAVSHTSCYAIRGVQYGNLQVCIICIARYKTKGSGGELQATQDNFKGFAKKLREGWIPWRRGRNPPIALFMAYPVQP